MSKPRFAQTCQEIETKHVLDNDNMHKLLNFDTEHGGSYWTLDNETGIVYQTMERNPDDAEMLEVVSDV